METNVDGGENAVARHDAPERDAARYTLTVKDASDLFAKLGVPRSTRSVQRFCEQGLVECIPVTRENGTNRYFIAPHSVERYAAELKQLQELSQLGSDLARHDAPKRDTARHDAPEPVAPVVPVAEPAEPKLSDDPAYLKKRVEELETDKLQLKIELSAKDQIINHMLGREKQAFEERQGLIARLMDTSHKLGAAEAHVAQLAAPKEPDVARHDAPRPEEASPTQEPVGEGRSGSALDPQQRAAASAAPERPRRSFLSKVFGE